MTILDWFDILFDGIQHGIDFLAQVDLGGISLADYIVVIFITSLVVTLFLNVVDTGAVMSSNYLYAKRREAEREKYRKIYRDRKKKGG